MDNPGCNAHSKIYRAARIYLGVCLALMLFIASGIGSAFAAPYKIHLGNAVSITTDSDQWSYVESSQLFKKNIPLLAHKSIPSLKGYVVTEHSHLRKGESFNHRLVTKRVCEELSTFHRSQRGNAWQVASYSNLPAPFCRLTKKGRALITDQFVFIERRRSAVAPSIYLTHVLTFTYPTNLELSGSNSTMALLKGLEMEEVK